MLLARSTCPLLLALVLVAAPLAHADGSPWYLGADLGQSRFTLKLPSPYSTHTPSASEDRRDTLYALSGGYRLNHYVALEAGYMNLGEYRLDYSDSTQTGKATIKAHGLTASALWQLPLGERWAVFLKTGVMVARAKGNASVTSGGETEHFQRKETAAVPVLGLGVSYAPAQQWTIRLQYQDIGAARVAEAAGYKLKLRDDVWSLGVTYGF